jgi:hypothetical protein
MYPSMSGSYLDLMCRVRAPDSVNDLPQASQVYGLSPETHYKSSYMYKV